MSELPIITYGGQAIKQGQFIYYWGGYTVVEEIQIGSKKGFRYFINEDYWEQIESMKYPRIKGQCCSIDEKICITGGMMNQYSGNSLIEIFNTAEMRFQDPIELINSFVQITQKKKRIYFILSHIFISFPNIYQDIRTFLKDFYNLIVIIYLRSVNILIRMQAYDFELFQYLLSSVLHYRNQHQLAFQFSKLSFQKNERYYLKQDLLLSLLYMEHYQKLIQFCAPPFQMVIVSVKQLKNQQLFLLHSFN